MNKDKKPLSETHPELAKEADGWDPKTVVAGTNKRLPWKCTKGHKWIAQGNDRTAGKNCPFCSNHRVLSGYNDLATTHPELAKEADGWDPTTVIAGTNKRLPWKCNKGHKWITQGDVRIRGNNCPFCSNNRVLAGYNDLATTHPELAKEADGWDPTTVIAGTNKRLPWKCNKGHKWIAQGNDRYSGKNCPFCSNNRVLAGYNDLATTHPELAKEAHGWDPTKITFGTKKKLDWKCPKGHVWSAVGYNRSKGTSCSVCANFKVLSGYNDLATTHPELAMQAHGWDPATVTAGTNKKLDWKCSKGHVWKAALNSRVNGNGCSVCSNYKVLVGTNDLATLNPTLAKEAHGWDPTKVVAGTSKKLDWKCSKGHVWKATVVGRYRLNRNCPYCANYFVLAGYNDLATTHPELAKQAHGWDPTTVVAGNEKKFEWKCHMGHLWTTSISGRSSGANCPVCVNLKVLAGYNDLATTHPELAKQAHGWDPTTVIAGTPKILKWKCQEGHVWKTSGHARCQGTGCPSCSKTGFDPNKPGYLYFMIQPKWELYQIGITNNPNKRLSEHSKNSFELLELRGPIDGHTAQELETALLRYLKRQKADLSPEHVAGKFDGYSESWTIDSYKVNNLKELIDKTSEAGF